MFFTLFDTRSSADASCHWIFCYE